MTEYNAWCPLCKKYISLVGGVADKHTRKGRPCPMSGKSLEIVLNTSELKRNKMK